MSLLTVNKVFKMNHAILSSCFQGIESIQYNKRIILKRRFETEIKYKNISLFLERQVFHDVKSVLSSTTMKVFILAIGEPYLKMGINNS